MNVNALVLYTIMQIMFSAKSKALPDCVQRECKYDLRGVCKFSVQKAKKRD